MHSVSWPNLDLEYGNGENGQEEKNDRGPSGQELAALLQSDRVFSLLPCCS